MAQLLLFTNHLSLVTARERGERFPLDRISDPRRPVGSETLIEKHGADVPVKHRPLEPQRAAGEDFAGELGHQRLADAAAPSRLGDHEILEIEERLRAKGAQSLIKQRDPFDLAVELRDERFQTM